jgi:hypothetical protein
VPRYTVGHICGHPFAHVADYRDQPREMQDLRRWHDWMHSQPCLSCSRPAGLIIAETDPAGDGVRVAEDTAGEFEWPWFIQSKALEMRRLIAWFWRVAARSARRPAARR